MFHITLQENVKYISESEGWGVSFSQYLAAQATPLTVCNVILDGTCNMCNFYWPYIKVTRQNE